MFQKSVQRIAATAPVASLLSKTLHHLDRAVYRWTKQRYTATSWLGGLPMLTLTTVGAKSGQPRSVPLIGIPDGDAFILIASNWGKATHPAWYHNIMANPAVIIQINGRSAPYTARELTGSERERCWKLAIATYVGYTHYVERAGSRQIPVIQLVPTHQN